LAIICSRGCGFGSTAVSLAADSEVRRTWRVAQVRRPGSDEECRARLNSSSDPSCSGRRPAHARSMKERRQRSRNSDEQPFRTTPYVAHSRGDGHWFSPPCGGLNQCPSTAWSEVGFRAPSAPKPKFGRAAVSDNTICRAFARRRTRFQPSLRRPEPVS